MCAMTYLPWNGVCGVNPTVGIEDIFWDVFCVNAVYRISDVPEKGQRVSFLLHILSNLLSSGDYEGEGEEEGDCC